MKPILAALAVSISFAGGGPVAQRIEHAPSKRGVAGSSPAGTTTPSPKPSFAGGGGHGDPLAMERTGQRRGPRGSASEESQPGKPTSQGPMDPVEPNRPQYGKSIANPEEKPLAGSTPAHQHHSILRPEVRP